MTLPSDISTENMLRSKKEKHAAHTINLVKKLANGTRPGVLATVDETGKPHIRWMATLSIDDFPLLYTLTSPVSRKIDHILHNPNVSWMFANDNLSLILNISGKARIEHDRVEMERIWNLIEDKSKAHFLDIRSEGPGFAVIVTEIEDMECVIPSYDFRFGSYREDVSSKRSPLGPTKEANERDGVIADGSPK